MHATNATINAHVGTEDQEDVTESELQMDDSMAASSHPSVFCAKEGEVCNCDNGVVLYGADSTWVSLRVKKWVRCSHRRFGGGGASSSAKICKCNTLGWCKKKIEQGETNATLDPTSRRRNTEGRMGLDMYQRRRSCGWGPINCQWGAWNEWNPCSVSCGFGMQHRSRPLERKAQNGGICNEAEGTQRNPCKLVDCGSGKAWNPVFKSGHKYLIKVANAALYMHAPGSGYRFDTANQLDDCTAIGKGPSCQWVLEPSNEPGHYYIKIADAPLYLLSKGGTHNGAPSKLGNCPANMKLRNCLWIILPSEANSGYYYLQASDANLYLSADLRQASAPIKLGPCPSLSYGGCQWHFEEAGAHNVRPNVATSATPATPALSNGTASTNNSGQVSSPKPTAKPQFWNTPLVEVTCRFTSDGTIGRVNYDDKDLTALVSAITSGWRVTKTLKFFERPGAVLTLEGVTTHPAQGCLNTGLQIACTANSTKSIWHGMSSNSTQWSAIGRAHGKFTAAELHGRGGWEWKKPCEARSVHLHLVEAPGVKKLWAAEGTKFALLKFPTWGQVVCKFMLDDHLESVFYNGLDITAKVTAFTSKAKKTKIIRFQEEPGGVLTIEGRSGEKSRIKRCAKSGLQIVCASSVTGSLWNGVNSNKGWKVKGSLKGNFDATSVKGEGKLWFWPCKSRQGKKIAGSA